MHENRFPLWTRRERASETGDRETAAKNREDGDGERPTLRTHRSPVANRRRPWRSVGRTNPRIEIRFNLKKKPSSRPSSSSSHDDRFIYCQRAPAVIGVYPRWPQGSRRRRRIRRRRTRDVVFTPARRIYIRSDVSMDGFDWSGRAAATPTSVDFVMPSNALHVSSRVPRLGFSEPSTWAIICEWAL